jgi:hypothetical protein
VRDEIPVMLVEEATALDDDSFERLSTLVAEQGIEPTFEI